MIEVFHNVFVGGQTDCQVGNEEIAVVHALKSPCHQKALQYKGSLPSTHPNYLALRDNEDLFLNLIDPPTPLFKIESFKIFKKFAKEQMEQRSLLIHCTKGLSRAPALAMILWKHAEGLEDQTYDFVKEGFCEHCHSDFDPGAGIDCFLREHWEEL